MVQINIALDSILSQYLFSYDKTEAFHFLKTVDKAMKLLDYFTIDRTEIGLSELSRLAAMDKATTLRILVSLSKHGFIEKNEASKQYRLGSGFMRLARVRESMFSLNDISREVAGFLTAQSGETAHISVPGNGTLSTIAYLLPERGNVVNIILAEALPLHATASGVVYLGFLPKEQRDSFLPSSLESFTDKTLVDRPTVLRKTEQAYKNGFHMTENSFEDEVSGIAMPFFNADGVAGTVAIAMPSRRKTKVVIEGLKPILAEASRRITEALGATLHPNVARYCSSHSEAA